MSDTGPVRQLKELFPHVAREFLKGLCDGYRSDELDINEIVEVVLSFEYPPLDIDFIENTYSSSSAQSADEGPTAAARNLLEESTPRPPTVSVHAQNADSPRSSNSLDSDDDIFTSAFNSREASVEATPVITVSTNENQQTIAESSSSDQKSGVSEGDYSKTLRLMFEESFEDDFVIVEKSDQRKENSPDISLQLVFENGVQNVSVSDEVQKQTLVEEDVEHCVTKSVVKEPPKEKIENENLLENADATNSPCCSKAVGTNCKQIKLKQWKQFNSLSPNSGSPQIPHTFSARKPSFRSCKIKNDEQRLRSKLMRLNRLSQKFAKDDNVERESDTCLEFGSCAARLSLLKKILPDAEVDYLSDQSKKALSAEEMLLFISKSLESRDYPKDQQDQTQGKMMERFECSVKDFLQVIPEPNIEFSSDRYIRTGYEGNAEIYLKSRYESLSEDEIVTRLKSCSYNLTRVTAELEEEGVIPGPYCLDSWTLHHEPSVFFHQEVWFIENRQEIQNYLDSVIEAVKIEEELNRPPTPPPVEEVFECGICREEVSEYSELRTCDAPIGHIFCKDCVRRSVEVGFGEAQTTFPCLHKHNCEGFIPLPTVKDVLPGHMYEKLMNKIFEAQVKEANIPGIETCPFCPYAYGPDLADLFICSNPECGKQSCRLCRKEYHSPNQCEIFREDDEERARHIIEERMSEALIRECTKPGCGSRFVKEAGCNKMKCSCGALMCYVCRQPVQDYSHFNGQGGDNTDRCPLFTDDAFVHDQPVQNMARRALDELIANNPNAGLDPTRLLPRH